MSKKTRSGIQTAEMRFLHRVAGHSRRNRVRSCVILEDLRVEPLLLHSERRHLRWHLFRMPPGYLTGEMFLACPTGKRPQENPGHVGKTMFLGLPGKHLGVPLDEGILGLFALTDAPMTRRQ